MDSQITQIFGKYYSNGSAHVLVQHLDELEEIKNEAERLIYAIEQTIDARSQEQPCDS